MTFGYNWDNFVTFWWLFSVHLRSVPLPRRYSCSGFRKGGRWSCWRGLGLNLLWEALRKVHFFVLNIEPNLKILRNLWNSAPPALGPFGPIKLLEYQTDLDLDFRALRECDPRQVLSTFQCKWIIATAFYEHKTPTTECKKCLNFPPASGGWGGVAWLG